MDVSIVIPAHNEAENILPIFLEIESALNRLHSLADHEVIFVDDGSTDDTRAALHRLPSRTAREISLSHRQGQSAALQAGFRAARYPVLVTMDADGQNDPHDIPAMLALLREGAHFVAGWRRYRRDPVAKRFASWIANGVRRAVLKDSFHDLSCSLRAFKRECVSRIDWFDGAHRFLPLLVERAGYRVVEMAVNHRPRAHGESKYGVRDRLGPALRGLVHILMSRKSRR